MNRSRTEELPRWARWASIGTGGAILGVLVARNFFRTEKKVQQEIETDYAAGDPTFVRSMSQLLGPPLLEGNGITALRNGAEIFPAMLEGIRSARRTITFENFVWWDGELAMRFAGALAERARAGVKVHMLQDALGCDSLHFGRAIRILRGSPVELEIFRFFQLSKINHRTHRKLLVIDGRTGFIGGAGIADPWDGNADAPGLWRDMHYRVEGPAVAQMQQAFMDNWIQTRGVVLHGDDYFPEIPSAGSALCQVFKSSATEGADSARLMLLLSVAAARHRIRIANAYFVPDDLTVRTLVDARRRGVEVEIITPGVLDQKLVRVVGRSRWGPLLEAGVRFYEFQTVLFHCKYMIVDDCWASVGSANFDDRSLRINEEANLNVLDAGFAAHHIGIFEDDKARSRRITIEDWRRRSAGEKCVAAAGGLLRSQM